MTVKELIEELRNLDEDKIVFVDRNLTYFSIKNVKQEPNGNVVIK